MKLRFLGLPISWKKQLNNIYMPILDFDFEQLLFRVKLISAILSFLVGALGIYFFLKFQNLIGVKAQMAKLSLRVPEAAAGAAQSRWEEVMRHLDSSREAEWKFAVIEADKLVDDVMKKAGYSGETMGDRLIGIEKGQLERQRLKQNFILFLRVQHFEIKVFS